MATPKDPNFKPPSGATLNEFGYWILPSGDFAPGQDMSAQMGGATPAQQAAAGGPVQTDASGKKYRIISGKKWYLPPMGGPTGDLGGGLVHGRVQWNPDTGEYDTPLDWGKILSMVAAGIITAGAADAVLSSTPALAATASAGASAAETTASAVLPSTTTVAGSAALPAGAASTLDAASAIAPVLPSTVTAAGSAPLPAGSTSSLYPAAAPAGKGVLDYANELASQLSSIATGRAKGAVDEAGVSQAQDRNAINLYGAEQGATNAENQFDLGRGNLALGQSNAANNFGLNRGSLANANAATDLAQRNFALTAPGKRAGNAVRGDILSNAQDVAFSGLPSNIPVPTISGGLRPSMFSADTRALGKDITSQARAAQAKGDTFAPLPDLPTYQAPEGGLPNYKAGPAAPTLTGLPSGGATSAIGNTSSILGLAPAFADIWRRYQTK